MLNQQPVEPFDKTTGVVLDVHALPFYTIQGEGPYIGVPAIFIRLAGCNLQCPLCDTDYTSQRKRMSVNEILDHIAEMLRIVPCGLTVITGGEPTRQNIGHLIIKLIKGDMLVQVESNGVLGIPSTLLPHIAAGGLAWIVSPKTSHIHASCQYATAFKYVISADDLDMEDGLPKQALGHKAIPRVARPPEGYKSVIYVSPADHDDETINYANMIACRDMSMRFGYRMTFQLHKLLRLP